MVHRWRLVFGRLAHHLGEEEVVFTLSLLQQTMYTQEPCTNIPDNLCKSLVLGGGGEMWYVGWHPEFKINECRGETVDTSDFQQTVWPRLGAIAERLWSPKNATQVLLFRDSARSCLLLGC